MNAEPILILQMQRMGDLILTFPLLLNLQKKWPNHPIWVVAEPSFFTHVLPLAPKVTFFPKEALNGSLSFEHYFLLINLSTHPLATAFMERANADEKLGPLLQKETLHIRGFWHIYRHSLIQNNRHNTFHWADLYRMDLFSPIATLPNIYTQCQSTGTRRVGLVLGASTHEKHPELSFWTLLARTLLKHHFYPFFFGGPTEARMGHELALRLNLASANLCGKLTLSEVANHFVGLDLCITPDTGPMHLANWLGIPVLNLSMGPVRCQETGPYAPGQFILAPKMSCAGCWQCTHKLGCKKKFLPTRVATLAQSLLQKEPFPTPKELIGLRLWQTTRSMQLFDLKEITASLSAEHLLDRLWRNVFLAFVEPDNWPKVKTCAQALKVQFPKLHQSITTFFEHLAKNHSSPCTSPPSVSLVLGFLTIFQQNENGSQRSKVQTRTWLAHIVASLKS